MNLTVRAWLIFSLSCIFYFYQFILQVSPDVMTTDLLNKFPVSEHRLAMVTAAFFLAYSLMQIPVGVILDKWGPHRLLAIAAIACGLGSILFAGAPYIFVASIARLLMGFGSAFAFVGALKLIGNWFPTQRFTFLMGVLVSIGMLGAIMGEAPLARAIIYFGWQNTMFILGGAGFILALLILLLVRNAPPGLAIQATPVMRVRQELPLILKNKQLWIIGICTGIISIPTVALTSLYGIPFLLVKFAVNETTAAKMISLILVGMVVGCPFWGAVSDHSKRRLPPLIIAAIVSPLLLGSLIFGHFSQLLLPQIILFAFGFFACGSLTSFSMAREINKPEHDATALSVINTFDTLGATLALPLLGRLLDKFWHGTLQHDIHVYELVDYQITMGFLLAFMGVAICLLPFIKETHAKQIA